MLFFPVDASRPAAGPSFTFGKLFQGERDSSLLGFDQFSAFDPAKPLVACKRRNVFPY